MTDRDHFAAAALTGLLANEGDGPALSKTCEYAYRIADAMLRERGNQPGKPDSSTVTEPMPKEKRAEGSFTLTDAEREAIEFCIASSERDVRSDIVASARAAVARLGGER